MITSVLEGDSHRYYLRNEKEIISPDSNPRKNLKRTFSKANPLTANALQQLPADLEELIANGLAWQLKSDSDIKKLTCTIKRLKTLCIYGTEEGLSAKDLRAILKANLQIEKLLASNSNIDNKALNAVPKNTIESISLHYCEKLSSQELIDFLVNNKQLKNLQLSHTLVTKDVAIAIAQHCSQLEVLELTHSTEIQEEDYQYCA
ncbi:MAG: hypothetical protein H0T62_00615 [Parachlamydiaceae bacterium]|nr:hypothetical protein [Parachlamydiaceae bacterium]